MKKQDWWVSLISLGLASVMNLKVWILPRYLSDQVHFILVDRDLLLLLQLIVFLMLKLLIVSLLGSLFLLLLFLLMTMLLIHLLLVLMRDLLIVLLKVLMINIVLTVMLLLLRRIVEELLLVVFLDFTLAKLFDRQFTWRNRTNYIWIQIDIILNTLHIMLILTLLLLH